MAVYTTRDQISLAIKEIIAKQKKISVDAVSEAATMQDIGADSLDLVEIMIQTEDACGVEINDDHAATLTTIGEFIDYVASLSRD